MQRLSSRCYTTGALIKLGWVGAERLYQPPSTDQIWYTGVGHHILLNCPILPLSTDSVATYNRKPLKLCNFRILSSLVASPSLLHKKSNVALGVHLQTLPTNSTRFVSQLQLLHGDIAFTNSVFPKAWRTKKQTKKHQTFCSPGGVQSPSPTKFGMVIEEVCPIFGRSKTCPPPTHSFAANLILGPSYWNTAFGAMCRR